MLQATAGRALWHLRLDLRRSFVTHLVELGVLTHVVEAAVTHRFGHTGGVAGVNNWAVYGPVKARAMQTWVDHLLVAA